MRPEQQNNNFENPHMQIMDLVLFCLLHNFRVVKQENKVHHVNLGIFPPHLHEIKHFNMAFKQINTNSILNFLNIDESGILLIYTIF